MRFYHSNGFLVYPSELTEEDDFIEAVSEDDRVVELIACTRIRVGASGTCEGTTSSLVWEWKNEKQMPKGFCALLRAIPAALNNAVEERKESGKPYKRWIETYRYLGYQLMDDDELLTEIMEDGLDEWLSQAE